MFRVHSLDSRFQLHFLGSWFLFYSDALVALLPQGMRWGRRVYEVGVETGGQGFLPALFYGMFMQHLIRWGQSI